MTQVNNTHSKAVDSADHSRWQHASQPMVDDPVVIEFVEEYQASLEVGERLDRTPLLERFPEIADELNACLDGLEFVHQIAPQLGESEGGSRPTSKQAVKLPAPLGDFRIVREIGRGGMGVVYEAEQLSLARRVALKVLPFAAVLDPKHLQRFKNEAQAAANLEHPHIVHVHSVGCERGVHYYAMQYIEGQSLAEVIDQLRQPSGNGTTGNNATDRHAPSRETEPKALAEFSSEHSTESKNFFRSVARLGIQAAEALQYAHEMGVVHRDIKPSNLLVDASGHLWVADFGLARVETDANLTMTGDLLGTLRYMSPEQISGERTVLDQRTDIYSLGLTLYELLTQQPAFGGKDRQAILRTVLEDEPRRPTELNRAIPADLETIVLKATSKEAKERYATAQELADDLGRFLDNQPILATLPSLGNRLVKWSRRHVGVVWTLVLASLALAVTLGVSAALIAASRNLAEQQRKLADEERDTAQVARQEARQERDQAIQNLYVSQMRMAQKDWDDGQIDRLQETLLNYLPVSGEPDLRGWEWYFHLASCHGELMKLPGIGTRRVRSIVWSPDGTQLAIAGSGGFKLLNMESGEVIETISHPGITGCIFNWSPAERRLAWYADDSRTAIVVQHGESRVTLELGIESGGSGSVAWSPDGNRLASNGPNSTVIIWDALTGEEIRVLVGHNRRVISLSWSPDGKQLAATSYSPNLTGTITIWDVESGKQTTTLESGDPNYCLAWSLDSRQLATGTHGGALVWDVASGEKVHSLAERGTVRSIVWSPDGSRFATGLIGGNITIRDAVSGKTLRTIRSGAGIGDSSDYGGMLAWSPNGKRIASGSGGFVKLWDVRRDPFAFTLANDANDAVYGGIAFSPDDRRLAYRAQGQTIKIRDAETGEEIQTVPGPTGDRLRPVWSPNGKHLACGGDDGSIVVFDLEKGEASSWQHQEGSIWRVAVAWHPDGKQLASTMDAIPTVRLWDASTGQELSSFDSGYVTIVDSMAWSPDGERLATSGAFRSNNGSPSKWGLIKIWDRDGWQLLQTIKTIWTVNLGWSRDGHYLAAGGSKKDPVVKVIDTSTGRVTKTLAGHSGTVNIAGWSEDGQRLATYAFDGVRIWNPHTAQEVFSIPDAKSMAWSHDRKRIATIEDGKVRVYDASKGYEVADDPSYRSQHANALAQALLREAYDLSHNGKYQQTLQKIETALSFAPNSGQIQNQAAWVILSLPDDQLTLQKIAKALSFAPGSNSTQLQAARAILNFPDDQLTLQKKIEKALSIAPDDEQHQSQVARAIINLPDDQLTLQKIEKALSVAPENEEIQSQVVTAILNLPDDQLTLQKKIEKALSVAPDDEQIRRQVAWVILHLPPDQLTLQKLEMALSVAPTDGGIQSWVAFHMLTFPEKRSRDIDKATAVARRGTELSPETGWNWMVLGIAQYRSGDWTEARKSLLKLVELVPDMEHPRTSCFLAMTCWQLGEKETARQHYNDAVDWIEKSQIDDEITLGFRDEAAELLGIEASNGFDSIL